MTHLIPSGAEGRSPRWGFASPVLRTLRRPDTVDGPGRCGAAGQRDQVQPRLSLCQPVRPSATALVLGLRFPVCEMRRSSLAGKTQTANGCLKKDFISNVRHTYFYYKLKVAVIDTKGCLELFLINVHFIQIQKCE